MPVRGEKPTEEKIVADKSVHEGVSPEVLELAGIGAEYLRLKKNEAKLKKDIEGKNKLIKEKLDKPEVYDLNGKHKELYAPLGDGVNEIFFQLQCRESVKTVPNIIELVRKKLGATAESYIMKVEVLHDTALQSLLNSNLITDADILEWTTTSETYALNVKVNKKKG